VLKQAGVKYIVNKVAISYFMNIFVGVSLI